MTDRKQPGVAFWATVVVVAGLVAYPLSMGPLQRVATTNYDSLPEWVIVAIVWYITPFLWMCEYGPEWLRAAMSRYLIFWLS